MGDVPKGYTAGQWSRYRRIYDDLESRGGRRQVSQRAWSVEQGVDYKTFRGDLEYLIRVKFLHRVYGATTFGEGQEPSTWRLLMGWDAWERDAERIKADDRQSRRLQRGEVRRRVKQTVDNAVAGRVVRPAVAAKAVEILVAHRVEGGLPGADDPRVVEVAAGMTDADLLAWG